MKYFNILLCVLLIVLNIFSFPKDNVEVKKEIVYVEKPAQLEPAARFFLSHKEEYLLLCQIIESEAQGESVDTRQKIAEVLIQRRNDSFTFSNMVDTPKMFDNSQRIRNMKIQDSTFLAVEKAFNNQNKINAEYFCSVEVANYFPSLFLSPIVEVDRGDKTVFFRKE